MKMTKKQVENQFKKEFTGVLNSKDVAAKRMAWNDYIDSLQKDGSITENQAYTWSTPSFVESKKATLYIDNKEVKQAISAAKHMAGYRELDIIENYSSYEITNNGKTADIYGKDGNGFQVVIKAFNGHKIGDITN